MSSTNNKLLPRSGSFTHLESLQVLERIRENQVAPLVNPAETDSYRVDVLPSLKIVGRNFVEVRVEDGKEILGRNVLLRGVNCGGNVKLPMGVRTQDKIDYVALKDPEYARKEITFVGKQIVPIGHHDERKTTGRPFPIEDAHVHFRRISRWGFNCLRFLVTWEVSHQKTVYSFFFLTEKKKGDRARGSV